MCIACRIPVELGDRRYEIVAGADAQTAWVGPLKHLSAGRHVAVVTDENVEALYRDSAHNSLIEAGAEGVQWLTVGPGETSKSREVASTLYDQLLSAGFGRDGVICALGGGVVGDLAGFVAATIHRGVTLIQMPTTLLAMVDSSIGGKVGINHPLGKNLIGAFHQPLAVLSNLETLLTLNHRELSSGFAEVIKYGVIADLGLLERLERGLLHPQPTDFPQLLDIIAASSRIKAGVVVRDEREGGHRMVLNFGHTIGHAVEATSGYGSWSHGEAVAVGMVMAAELGCSLGVTSERVPPEIRRLCRVFDLPTELPQIDCGALATAIRLDKKVRGGHVMFVLPHDLGEVEIHPIALEQLTTWLSNGAA